MSVAIEPNLYRKYREEIRPALQKEFGYGNVMLVPKLDRVVVSMGVKEAAQDVKIMDGVAQDLAMITGQKPQICRAKKSISAFKLREGMPLGLKVTLRKARMYEFVERLITVAMPRIRDFRGIPTKSFDGSGNYSFGINEQAIFPEVSFDRIVKVQGMNICFVTSAKTDDEARRLLELLGLPFRKN